MTDTAMTSRIHDLYAAFNRRDSSFVIDQMAPDVTWPRAFKGGHVEGGDAVRAYWEDQWQEIDPTVEPVSIEPLGDGRFDVEVHQVVKDLDGTVIADSIVHHVYTFDGELIASMDLPGEG
ncbi:MAG: nuclear transport factor 2 family protein [Solirubrobacteraceae bacterium]|nr:nuclear transport factor 2 family protein [Patulibacter sp.]